jgi:hypothetical protein
LLARKTKMWYLHSSFHFDCTRAISCTVVTEIAGA